jgi:subtilisin family serine protease
MVKDRKFLKISILILILLNLLVGWQKASAFQGVENFLSWALTGKSEKSMNLPAQFKSPPKKNIVVAVIDTGVDPNHPFIRDNIIREKNTNGEESFGRDFSKNAGNKFKPVDTHGHGTHIAGLIKSIYPKSQLLILKYYNPEATGKENLISALKALEFAVSKNVDIINYSGGGPEASNYELELLKQAKKKGIMVVAAAGNDQTNLDLPGRKYYPASYGLSNILNVTTYDSDLKVHESSNYGKELVDVAAPGDRIKGPLPNGRAGYLTGTSQATALVSGAAALIKAHYPSLSPEEIKEIISLSVDKHQNLKDFCKSGGRVNIEKSITLAAQRTSSSQRQLASSSQSKMLSEDIIYRFKNK